MKRCLGLIAALGLATVASATSITWSGTNVTGSQTIFGTDATKTDFSLAVKITTDFASKTLSNTNMLTFGNNLTDGSPAGLLAYSAANGFGGHFDSGTVSKWYGLIARPGRIMLRRSLLARTSWSSMEPGMPLTAVGM